MQDILSWWQGAGVNWHQASTAIELMYIQRSVFWVSENNKTILSGGENELIDSRNNVYLLHVENICFVLLLFLDLI